MSCKPLISPEAEHTALKEFLKLTAHQFYPHSIPAAQTWGITRRKKIISESMKTKIKKGDKKNKKLEFMLAQRPQIWSCLIKPWKKNRIDTWIACHKLGPKESV